MEIIPVPNFNRANTHKMMKFTRPTNLLFPTTYRRFQAKDKDSNEIIEYRIQDLLEEDYEIGIDMMISEYCPEESFNRCRGVSNSPEALAEKRIFWRSKLDQKLSVGSYKGNELVGVCILTVHVKNENEDPLEVRIETLDFPKSFYFISKTGRNSTQPRHFINCGVL